MLLELPAGDEDDKLLMLRDENSPEVLMLPGRYCGVPESEVAGGTAPLVG